MSGEKSWIARRKLLGAYHGLVQELSLEDRESYRRYVRMDSDAFQVGSPLALHSKSVKAFSVFFLKNYVI